MKRPIIISALTLACAEREPTSEEVAASYRIAERMAELAQLEPFILRVKEELLLVSRYVPPVEESK